MKENSVLAAGETDKQDLKSHTLSPDNVCKAFHRTGNLELSNPTTSVVNIAQREWHWGIQRGGGGEHMAQVQESPPVRAA